MKISVTETSNGGLRIAQGFAERLRSQATEYFTHLNHKSTRVDFIGRWITKNSFLFEFRLSDGQSSHNVIAKAPFSTRRLRQDFAFSTIHSPKPSLFPLSDLHSKGLHEFRALSVIFNQFTKLNDPRFSAIRPLDVFGEPLCLLMEKANDQDMRVFCRKVGRTRRQARGKLDKLVSAIHNAGAWLQRFHRLPLLAHTECRNAHRNDIIATIEAFSAYIDSHASSSTAFTNLSRSLISAAERVLPAILPLGLTHGDFAPRNVLQSREGRVTVFDTQGRWYGPIYVDLAHFLVALKVSSAQICSNGWYNNSQVLAIYEDHLFRGYFENRSLPLGAIRLFECLLLLEWWVTLTHFRYEAKGTRRVARWGQLLICTEYLKRYVQQLLDELNSAPPHEEPAAELRWSVVPSDAA